VNSKARIGTTQPPSGCIGSNYCTKRCRRRRFLSCFRILRMTTSPVVYPPLPWANQDIVLYHGTVDAFAASILAGVRVKLGKPNTDFGPGFYTTTLYRQAHSWAAQIAASKSSGAAPAVIQITISRDALAGLKGMSFVRGDFLADDYWSFVHYCRLGALDHGRSGSQRYYDVVYGPVAAFWNQRMSIADADQVSFHTAAAEKVLNSCVRKRII
jgi:Protein of unknown function (DUF3990)